MTTSGWVFTERDVVRLLALTPRRAEQLRRLGLLHAPDHPEPYRFRDLVGLRVAKGLLEAGLTVRQIRKALDGLRRLVPESDAPLAELRVTVQVTQLAKWKTTLQLVAIGFLLAGDAGDAIVPVVTPIGLSLLWLSALLTLYTGWDYFRAGVRHLIED